MVEHGEHSDRDLVIDVTGLTKSFGNRKVVDNVDIQVSRGEIYGFRPQWQRQDDNHSTLTRTFVASLENSGYFKITAHPQSVKDAENLLARGDVQFVIEIPANFSRDLVRGARPAILLDADATDPAATGNAIAAINTLARDALNRDLTGPLLSLRAIPPPFQLITHQRYNPENRTQYNIVLGVILTLTLVMFTALAVTREAERSTMENLLTTPAHQKS